MKNKQHITAFYMEILVLVAVFTVVMLILTRVFALSGRQSAEAGVLTKAVHLAENTAEAVAAADSEEGFLALFGADGSVSTRDENGHRIYEARYNDEMEPAAEGSFLVRVEWLPEDGAGGELVKSTITVYWKGGEEPVYTLETGVFLR